MTVMEWLLACFGLDAFPAAGFPLLTALGLLLLLLLGEAMTSI